MKLLKKILKKKIVVREWEFEILTVLLIGVGIVIGTYGTLYFINGALAASTPWTQTDWSGGVASGTVTGTVNTYESQSDVDTTVAGQTSLSTTACWSGDYASWGYRKQITFDNTTASLGTTSEALIDFPVLVKLDTGTDIDYSKTKDAGEDIRFTDGDGTVLSYEIEKWDETGASYVWVKVPQIDIDSNTDFIYMYYGNAAATDAQNAINVWDSNYVGVWHLSENPAGTVPQIIDSTNNNNDGTSNGSMTLSDLVNGQIFNGLDIDASDDYVSVPHSESLLMSNTVTFEAWVKVNAFNNYQGILTKGYSSANSWGMHIRNDLSLWFDVGATNCTRGTLQTGSWQYTAGVYDGSAAKVMLQGQQVGTTCNIIKTLGNTEILRIGRMPTYGTLNGVIDEVRISNVARSNAWIAASYNSGSDLFATYLSEQSKYASSGTLSSNIFNAEYAADWGVLSYTTSGSGTVTVKVRSDTNADMSTATAWGSCGGVSSGTDLSATDCVTDTDQYLQYQVTLQPSGGSTPVFEDISIAFTPSDVTAPPTNASSVTVSGLNSGWAKVEQTINWTAGADNGGGSGILGYCMSLEEVTYGVASSNLNPASAGGILTGINDGVSQTYCPFIVTGTSVDLSSIAGLNLTSNKSYYISMKAVDIAGNIYSGATYQNLATFDFDNVLPTNPTGLSGPQEYQRDLSAINIYWPTSGGAGPTDDASGVKGYQYKINNGTWYGVGHTGAQDCTDLFTTGAYNLNATYDSLNVGDNTFYLRTYDNACNVTTSLASIILKYNATAPSEPTNLIAAPTSNTTNSFAFSWDSPLSFSGLEANLTYCYTINAVPTALTCTFGSATTLSAGPYATQQGVNTFYVVAKDEAENVSYGDFASVEFTATTTAPGIPQNVQALDSSNRETSKYQITVSWDAPASVGEGVANYNIYRSTDGVSFSLLSTVGSSSTAYLDAGLSNTVTYYYKVSASDNASSEGALSAAVSKLPTGAYTTPPNIIVSPTVVTSILSATVSWQMDRACVGYIQLKENETFVDKAVGVSATTQSISVTGLLANTQYDYRIRCEDVDNNIAYSSATTFTTSDAPSAPISLAVTPTTNIANSFGFSWSAPSDPGVTIASYYYSINQEPTSSNITQTTETSLSAGSYATQQGINTFYVVAVDTAGNYNLDNYASVDFTATTTAPGIPTNISISDASDRMSEDFALTIRWLSPQTGDVAAYQVYRSLDGESFVFVAQTQSTIYAESGLDNSIVYYYKIKAVDNAGAESAYGSTVSAQPTGRFTDPPTYTSEPIVSTTSSSATISWTTDRVSTSFVQYGVVTISQSNGSLNETVFHQVELTGLSPSTTYTYKLQSFDDARSYELSDSLSREYTFTTSVAPAISDVKVEGIRQTSALVSWKTTTVSTSIVKYGLTAQYGSEVNDESTGATTVHTVRLTDLTAESLYHVRIFGTDVEGNILQSDDYVFQTLAFPRIINLTFEPVKDQSSATVKVDWETNVDTDSVVEYAPQGQNFKEKAVSILEKEHELVLSDLIDNASYSFRAKGRDQFGNVATSETISYDTPFDTRPPKISNITIETSINGVGADAKAQIIVSWRTDENATSQVEFEPGVGGETYSKKTVEDATLTNSHVVIISDIESSRPYHLRAVSRDGARNTTFSNDQAVITGKVSESALDLIIGNLQESFGWLGSIGNLFR